jgi:hypothetical protein
LAKADLSRHCGIAPKFDEGGSAAEADRPRFFGWIYLDSVGLERGRLARVFINGARVCDPQERCSHETIRALRSHRSRRCVVNRKSHIGNASGFIWLNLV